EGAGNTGNGPGFPFFAKLDMSNVKASLRNKRLAKIGADTSRTDLITGLMGTFPALALRASGHMNIQLQTPTTYLASQCSRFSRFSRPFFPCLCRECFGHGGRSCKPFESSYYSS